MKNIGFIMLAATALLVGGCAAGADQDANDDPVEDQELTGTRSDALMNVGGGSGGSDPDECMAMLQGCYQACAKSGSASCYHSCDIFYAQCRGLPPPDLVFAASATDPKTTSTFTTAR